MKKINNEMKTGLVIVMAILVAIFFWLKTSKPMSKTYELKTQFSQANGIKANSVVALAGIEVGRVDSTRFIYNPDETRVELVLILD